MGTELEETWLVNTFKETPELQATLHSAIKMYEKDVTPTQQPTTATAADHPKEVRSTSMEHPSELHEP